MSSLNTIVIILTYNSSKNIENCFNEIMNYNFDHINEIVFLDNNSRDNSVELIKNLRSKFKFKEKIKLFVNNENYNQGGSIKIGINYFLSRKSDNVIFVHSSGKCKTDEIVNNFFIAKNNNQSCDVIHASRFHKNSNLNNYSKMNTLGNVFFNYLTFFLTGYLFSDSGCGIIFSNKKAFSNIDFNRLTNGPQFNPQLNILFKKNKIKIINCPINWSHGIIGTNVKIIKYSLILLIMLLKYFIFYNILKKNDFWYLKQDHKFDYNIL